MSGGFGQFEGWRALVRRPIEIVLFAALVAGCGRAEFFDAPSAAIVIHDGGLAGGCTVGQACIPANRCELGQTSCTSGVAHCLSINQPDFSADGQACQSTGICQAGVCQLCAAGGSCLPANVCHLGTNVCTGGQSTCQDTGAPNPAANGSSCGSNQVCENGACVACNPGAGCKAECQIGTVSCAGGTPTCVNLMPDPGAEGQPCGNGGVCEAGACVPPSTKRPAFPQVPDQGGTVLGNPELVTITFQNYPHRAEVEALGSWMVTSSWLTTVGADYGVGLGSAVTPVELAFDAPASASQSDVESLIAKELTAGTLPSPSSLGGQGVYMVYFPQDTQLSNRFGNGCSSFRGYHDFFAFQGTDIAYAVIADCPPFALGDIELVASHELIEAATDPHPVGAGPPTGWAISDPTSPWVDSIGPEVADLCITLNDQDAASGFFVQRIWSNTAAKGNGSPCVPAPNAPFFTVSASPDTTQLVSAGGSFKFTLTGWSNTPAMGAWNLQIVFGGQFSADPQLSASTITNGGSVDLTLSVPSDATFPMLGWAAVQSLDTTGQVVSLWPAVVVAK
jgi:hypothetical protein